MTEHEKKWPTKAPGVGTGGGRPRVLQVAERIVWLREQLAFAEAEFSRLVPDDEAAVPSNEAQP